MRSVSLLLILALCPSAFGQKPEPRYDGKPLAYWHEKFKKAETDAELDKAAVALMAFGVDGAPIVPELVPLLDDRSASYRHRVADILCKFGPGAKSAMPDLIKLLQEKPPRDPNQVIRILCEIGPDAKDAIPVLRQIMVSYVKEWNPLPRSQEHFDLQIWSFNLHNLGPDALPMLLEIAEHDTHRIAGSSPLRTIQEFGSEAKPVAPQLAKLLKHTVSETRLEAAVALWKINKDAAAITALIVLLKDKDERIIISALGALGEIGPDAKDALPAVRTLHESSHSKVESREGTQDVIYPDRFQLYITTRTAISRIAPEPMKK